jgi:hypothetical protein
VLNYVGVFRCLPTYVEVAWKLPRKFRRLSCRELRRDLRRALLPVLSERDRDAFSDDVVDELRATSDRVSFPWGTVLAG